MITEFEIKKLFLEKNALLEGHFQLTSGRHSENYLQCALLLQYPDIAEKLGESLVLKIKESNGGNLPKVDLVISPALGGIVFGHAVGKALKTKAIFAERESGAGPLKLRRGFSIQPGESVFAVEDVITTGGSLKEVVELVKSSGGNVVGVGAVAERSITAVDFGTLKTVLLKLSIKDYLPEECPICKKGIPVVKPGSRKK